MQRNNLSASPGEEELVLQLRSNRIFEAGAFGSLLGAAIAAAAYFFAKLIGMAISRALAFDAAFSASLDALVVAIVFFLIAFSASAFALTAMFRNLERRERRSLPLYIVAICAFAILTLFFVSSFSGMRAFSAPFLVAVASGVGSYLTVTAARLRQLWREADSDAGAGASRIHRF